MGDDTKDTQGRRQRCHFFMFSPHPSFQPRCMHVIASVPNVASIYLFSIHRTACVYMLRRSVPFHSTFNLRGVKKFQWCDCINRIVLNFFKKQL